MYHVLRQQLAHSSSSSSTSSSTSGGGPDEQQQRAAGGKQQRWPRAADDVCKAVSKRLKQADSAGAVLAVVKHHAGQFNAVSSVSGTQVC